MLNEATPLHGTTYFNDFFPVLGGIHGRLRQQDLAIARVDVELLWAKGVVPQVLHVIPVPDNAIFHGVVHLQHGAQLAGLVPHHQVLRAEVKGQGYIPTHRSSASAVVQVWNVTGIVQRQ